MIVIAFDPGKTTGVCVGRYLGVTDMSRADFEVLWAAELAWEDRHQIGEIIKRYLDIEPVRVVYESFNLYPGAAAGQAHIRSSFPSVEIIGIISTYVHMLGLTEYTHKQPPATRGRVQIMGHHKRQIKGPHIRDAYKHLRYYLLSNEDS